MCEDVASYLQAALKVASQRCGSRTGMGAEVLKLYMFLKSLNFWTFYAYHLAETLSSIHRVHLLVLNHW